MEPGPHFARHVAQRTVVLPQHRVLFLPMPKAGCTSVLWLLAELAGLAGVAALVLVELPFVSVPVWFTMSSANLDVTTTLQPWATCLWTLSCVTYIAAYAVWGFIAPRHPKGTAVPASKK